MYSYLWCWIKPALLQVCFVNRVSISKKKIKTFTCKNVKKSTWF